MNKADIKQKLDEIFRQRQQNNIDENLKRIREVSEKSPKLKQAIEERHKTLIFNAKSKLGNVNNSQIDIADYMRKKNQEIKELLKTEGFSEDYLQPQYSCSICKDEGILYEPYTKQCHCYIKEMNRLNSESLGFENNENQSFDNYNEEVFSNDKIDGFNYNQREYMSKIRDYLQEYSKEFPENKKTTRDILLIGSSGLGKTYMMRSVANSINNKGYNIVCLSAYKWFELARASYFGNNEINYNDILYCDLLMIDDLGTEPLMNNITVEQLFNVINERQNKNLHTIISTNLRLTELSQRYTERIISRFEDTRYSTILTFKGKDIRKNMKRE